MKKNIINVQGRSAGPIASHAIEINGFIFLSGIIPYDAIKNELVSDDIKTATALVLNLMAEVLNAAGSGMDKVVKTTIYLRDMEDWNDMNEVCQTYFPKDPPTRTTIEVQRIALDLPIEIEAIAYK
jgi:2-iminobutanoate/2-iminopropanoate deaminase